MEFHPVAEIFPLMPDADFELFCADIAENGLRDPIWTCNDKIIDGRNRYLACERTGVEPRFREYEGPPEKLVSFVVSLNLHRRHLSESQRAMVAARIANLKDGQRASSKEEAVTQAQAAQLLNVSKSSVERAAKVQTHGVPELAEKVDAGELPVSQAAKIAALPKGKQKRLIRKGRAAGQKILTRLKIESLKKLEKESGCLLCDPNARATHESVSAFMQLLASRHPAFRTYFQSVVDELEEMKLSEETVDAREKIRTAIALGFQTAAEIQAKTRLDQALLDHTLAVMIDYNEIYAVVQGGKTDGARGARKTLYKLVEEDAADRHEHEYEEEFV
jgi:hypothetical protein